MFFHMWTDHWVGLGPKHWGSQSVAQSFAILKKNKNKKQKQTKAKQISNRSQLKTCSFHTGINQTYLQSEGIKTLYKGLVLVAEQINKGAGLWKHCATELLMVKGNAHA